MTIMATHFAIVLGAWRLRVRIDLDEPREDAFEGTLAGDRAQSASAARNGTRARASAASPWN